MRVLIDVDGVVADLIGGFEFFIRERFAKELRPREITTFNITRSPAQQSLHVEIDLDRQLADFLTLPGCYDSVHPIEGAEHAIRMLIRWGFELVFVTATLEDAPESYASKFRWLRRHFPKLPVISCPSGQKHWFNAEYGIDDRYDTCQRWSSAGVKPLLFRQPWNEAPLGTDSFDWSEILDFLQFA